MLQDVLDWAPAVGPFLVFALLLFLPGALVLWGAGMRLRRAFAFAPVVSTALAGGGAVALSLAGIEWGVGSYAGIGALAFVMITAIRWAVQRRSFRFDRPPLTTPNPATWWTLAGLAVNALVVAWLYIRPTGAASSPAYEYDTIWHFSVIRWITETGDASSLNTGLLDGTVGNHFYPAAWHSLVALTAEITGAPIAASVHGSILLVLTVVWPIGLVWLFRTLFSRSALGAFAISAMAFLPAVFPVGFFAFGLLYPNFFSYSLAPACLVILIRLLREVGDHSWKQLRPQALATIVAVLCIPVAILFAQPNSAFTLLVILLPLVYVTIVRFLSPARLPRVARWAVPAAVSGFSLLLIVAWVALHDSSFLSRTVAVDVWQKYQTEAQAVGEWLLFGNGTEGQLLLGVLAIIGLVLVFTTRVSRWWAVSYALLGTLFVVASAAKGGPGSLRSYLVGFWYADSTRLAAAGAIVALPLMALAIVALARWGAARFALRRAWGDSLTAVALTVIVVVFSVTGAALENRAGALREKAFTGDEQWVSPAEEDFLDRTAEIVGPDAVVANNPFDGSTMGYSLNGIQMLFPALPGNWMGVPSADQQVLMTALNTAATDTEVCRAVTDLGVEYVIGLDTGERGIFGDAPQMFAGIIAVTGSTPGFEPVLEDGDFALYRVSACAT
jgi:hypothetical protein